jgi:hypothetical protein
LLLTGVGQGLRLRWRVSCCKKDKVKNKSANLRQKKSLKAAAAKYRTPEWMDDELKPTASKLDISQRHALAAKLERQAGQLRGLSEPSIDFVAKTEIELRPNVKKALLLFCERHGSTERGDEKQKLSDGARWFLETALPMIERVSEMAQSFTHYRDTEGLEDSVYSERLIGDALTKWEAALDIVGDKN